VAVEPAIYDDLHMLDDFAGRLAAVLGSRRPRRADLDDVREAAVLLPIVAVPEPTLIFTVRTDTLPSHKGQISFPGGSIDQDDPSPEAAALREAQEEIGLDPKSVRILGGLDDMPTYVSGYVVSPFVGWLDEAPDVAPNPAEVAEILSVPISELVEEIREEAGFRHGGRTYPTEAWIWNGHVIWGVTARLLRSFMLLLAEAGLAEPPGETTSWAGPPPTRSSTA
jgi:8-oxo-dGTP pyrophosphatase MutT (NUDIX family)